MSIDAASFIDMGFTILVAVTCFKCLVQKREDAVASTNPDISKELRELESSIKFLIDEAGAASRNLDRRLSERKRELEAILEKFENKEANLQTLSERIEVIRETAEPREERSDFPNESWEKRASQPLKKMKREQSSERSNLDQLVAKAETQDSVSLHKNIAPKKGKQTMKQKAKESLLSQQIEALQEQKETQKGLARTGIKDPVAYRVAKRLLQSGKEIHVVSRKLELTLDQVRALDKLVREERGESSITSNPLLKSHPVAQKGFEIENYSVETEESEEEQIEEAYTL